LALTAPVLTAGPADGSTDTDTTPTFSWNAVATATGYKVSVDGSGSSSGGSAPSQVGIIILENESGSTVAASNAPTMHGLQSTYRDYTAYQATSHPSLPNYCAMSSGSFLGKVGTDNGSVGFAGTAANIMHQLELAGKSWKAYEEGVTAAGFTSWTGNLYGGKHCPAAFYTTTKTAGIGAGNGRFDFSGTGGLVADINSNTLPDFFYITPNLLNDGHNLPPSGDRIKYSDDWLAGLNPNGNSPAFPGITALIAAMRPDGVLFVTYDEGSGSNQTIYTVCVGQRVTHSVITAAQSHWSLLYGIQQNFGQPKFTEQGQNLDSGYVSVANPIPIPQTGSGSTGSTGIDLGTTRTYTPSALPLGGHDFQVWAYDGSGDGPHTTVDWSIASSAAPGIIDTVQVIQENPAWTSGDKEIGRVDAICYDPTNNILYVGGNFHGTNSLQRKDGTKVSQDYLFAINWADQTLIDAWKPQPNGRVYSIWVSPNGGRVYVGGDFTSIGSTPVTMHNLACLNPATGTNAGTVQTTRMADLAFNGTVHRLAATPDGNTLYAAGNFTAPASTGTRLCKLDLTPTLATIVGTWKPSAGDHVRALAVDPNSNRLLVGGDFTTLNGATKNYLGAIRQDGNGETLPFAYTPGDRVLCACTDGQNVYFGTVNDLLVKCDWPTGTSQWGAKSEDTDGNVQAVAYVSPYVIGGMHGDCVGNAVGASSGAYSNGSCGVATGIVRHKVWRQTAASGALDQAWDPSLTSTAGVLGVWALEAYQDQVWMGGDFTKAQGAARARFAAFGTISTPPPPPPTGDIVQRAGYGFGEGATTASTAPPGTYQAGDLLVAHVTAVGATPIVAPSGWVAATPIVADGTALASCVYTKTAAASEQTANFSCAGATSLTAYMTAWQNAAGVTVSGGTATSGGGTVTLTSPSISGAVAKDEILTFAATTAGPRPYPDAGGVLVGAMDTPTDWSTQAGIAAIETVAGRKLGAAHSMVPWDCHVGATHGDFTGGSQAPTVDYQHNRLTYVSWPRPRPGADTLESSWQSIFGTGSDPVPALNAIAAGTYDSIIDANAAAYAAFKHPIIIRLLWEANGGGLIWGIGKTTQAANYNGAYIAACQRIITRTRAVAKNAFFHWNPQNFQTIAGSAGSRDNQWWGDTFAAFAGTEGYLSPGDTFPSLMTNTSSNGATYTAIYSGYGVASSHKKVLGNGEGGNRYQGTSDTTAAAARIDSLRTGLPQFPDWRFYMWWNANGSNGNSDITAQPTACKTAFANWLAQSYTTQRLSRSWQPLTQTQAYEDRRTLGTIGTCYGAGQQGSTLVHTTSTGGVATPITFQTYGYGSHVSLQVAISTTVAPPPPPPPPDATLADTFTRTTTSGWGTCDSGFAWQHVGGTRANASTDGATGVLAFPAPQTMIEVLDPAASSVDYTDTDIADTFTFDVDPTGGDYNVQTLFRYLDADNTYRMSLKVGVSTVDRLTFQQRVGGVQTDLNASFSLGSNFFTAGNTYARRVQCDIGGAMRAKVWDTSGAEPVAWTVEVAAPATDPLPHGGIGYRTQTVSGTTSTPTFQIDDLIVSAVPVNPPAGTPPADPTFTTTPPDSTLDSASWTVAWDPDSTSAEWRSVYSGSYDTDTGWLAAQLNAPDYTFTINAGVATGVAPETVTIMVRSSNSFGTSGEVSDSWERLAPPPPPPPDTGVVWWCTSGQAVNTTIQAQETVVGRTFLGARMNINFTSPSIGPNDTQYDLGRIYTYRNSNWQTATPKAPLSWAEVAKGTYDSQYIIPFFNQLKADTGRWDGSSDSKTFYFSPHHEQTVNNPPSQVGWDPTGFPAGCGTVSDYVDMYRHVRDLADSMHVTRKTKTGVPNGGNCDFVYCPLTNMYIQPQPGAGVPEFDPDNRAGGTRTAAPVGTSYYEVLGVDWYAHWDYNKLTLNHTNDAGLIGGAVHDYAVLKGKDWIVPECGIGSDTSVSASEDAKAAYLVSMRNLLKSYGSVSPGVCRALFYTPEANAAPSNYSFDSSPQVEAAATGMANDPYFMAGLNVQPPTVGPPSVTVTQPVSGTTVSGTTVSVTASASETSGGISQVTMSINNGAAVALSPGSVDAQGNGTYIGTATLTASASPGTANTIKVTATDNQIPAQSTTAATVTVNAVTQTTDTTAPTLTINNPAGGADATVEGVSGTQFTVTGVATDASGIQSLVVAFGGNHTRPVAADGSWSYVATLTTGANAFTVTATDNSPAQNQTVDTFTLTLTAPASPDIVDPTLAVTQPADDVTIVGSAGDTYTVIGNATDASGIASVTVNSFTASVAGNGNFSFPILLASGANTVTVVATDASVNSNTTTISRTVTLVSTLGPTLTITTPSDGAVIQGDDGYLLQIVGSATAATGVARLTVNGVDTLLASNGNFSQIVSLATGQNHITITAVDAQQIPQQTTVSLTVTLVPPSTTDVGGITVSSDQQRIAGELQDRGVE